MVLSKYNKGSRDAKMARRRHKEDEEVEDLAVKKLLDEAISHCFFCLSPSILGE